VAVMSSGSISARHRGSAHANLRLTRGGTERTSPTSCEKALKSSDLRQGAWPHP
jgi:hypothetical protein